MKKRLLRLLLLVVFTLSGMTAWAGTDQVQKESWEMTGFQVSWSGGPEDEYGVPAYNYLSIDKLEDGTYRLFLGREYVEEDLYQGFYEFYADLPMDTLDLRKCFREPFDLDLTLDGMAKFYPPDPEEPGDTEPGDKEPPDYEEPVPFPDSKTIQLHAEPSDAIRVMLKSQYRSDTIKTNDMTKGRLTDLAVTGTIDEVPFESAEGILQMVIFRNITIGTYEEVPPIDTKYMASVSQSKGTPQTLHYSQMYMQAWADRQGVIGDMEYSEWIGASLYLGTDSLEVYTDYGRFDPVNEVDINEYFSGYIENYVWDPADFAEGVFSLSVEVTGWLTRYTYPWDGTEPIEESYETTRRLSLTFDLNQIGTTRSFIKVGSKGYSGKERMTGLDYSGAATISIDDADPIPAQGYATYIKGTARLFGDYPQ